MTELERLRRELERVRAEVDAETERHILALAKLHVRESRTMAAIDRLPKGTQVGTIGAMEATRGANISAAKTRSGVPWQAHLRIHGLSIPGWVGRAFATYPDTPPLSTVRSWVKRPGHGGRPIPRLWADRLAAEFSDTSLAMSASWPSGIR